jgi:NCS1 family nucleobase:cation symporter-1
MASSHNYLGWLVDYSGLLGPVAGIMVADYFLVRHTKLDPEALYRRGGIYEYRNGFNLVALIALVVGIVAALIGKFVPSLDSVFKMAWFVGFFLSGGLYYIMMLDQRVGPSTVSE